MLASLERVRGADTRTLRALDVAMGRGRHTVLLARRGYKAFGVDIKLEAIRDAVHAAAAESLSVAAWCADLTRCALPSTAFDLVVVTRYLQRDLFGALRDTLKPNGAIIYETFTTAQRALGTGPTSPEHLLEPGELRARFDGLEIVFYEEVTAPEAVARLVARRASNRS